VSDGGAQSGPHLHRYRLVRDDFSPERTKGFFDGKRGIAGLKLPQTPVVEGDRLLPSIAAASIIAKVTRDRIMEELGSVYPGYGFEQHKGYGTLRHLTALAQWGPWAVHRHSFMPVVAAERRQLDFFLVERRKATNATHKSLPKLKDAAMPDSLAHGKIATAGQSRQVI
jgi:Ribonuclease HII